MSINFEQSRDHKASKARGLTATLSALTLALTSVVWMPSVALASNDRTTYLDENFNSTGYMLDSTTSSSIEIEGVLGNPNDLNKRKIVVSVEDSKAILRAYAPSNTPSGGYVGGWSNSAGNTTPSYSYGPETTFNSTGLMDLGYTGVSQILIPHQVQIQRTSGRAMPRLIVTHSSGHELVRLEDADLQNCTTCTPVTQDISTAVTTVGGSGALVTGFAASNSDDQIFVSGVDTVSQRPFVARVNIADGSVADSKVLSSYPTDYSSANYNFEPVVGGLASADNVLTLAGNLISKTDPNDTVGVIFRLIGTDGNDDLFEDSSPANVVIKTDTATKLSFATNYDLLGGSYRDGGQWKPLLVASSDGTSFFTTKLDVDSTSDTALSSANLILGNGPINNSIKAVANEDGNLRVYTWRQLSGANQVEPDHTEVQTFASSNSSVSAYVTEGRYQSPLASGKMVFAAFDKVGDSSITASVYQAFPVVPRVLSAPTLEASSDWLSTRPNISVQGLGSPSYSYFTCDATYAGSSLTESTTSAPTGCTEIAGVTFANASFRPDARLEDNKGLFNGNIVLRYTYSNPDFVYWSNSVLVQSGGSSTPTSPSFTAPEITSVKPLRGGAEVSFSLGNYPGTEQFAIIADPPNGSGLETITAVGTSSPITVGGLEDGVDYTFTIYAETSDGGNIAAGSATPSTSTLQPGAVDTSFFATPAISSDVVAETVLAPSGNTYMISADVRRYTPTGELDTQFGTSGVAALPSPGPTVLDVREAEDGLIVLIDDSGTKKIVVYNDDGTVKTDVGTSGVITPLPPSSPTFPLAPKIDFSGTTIGDGSGISFEIPGVVLPSGLPINSASTLGPQASSVDSEDTTYVVEATPSGNMSPPTLFIYAVTDVSGTPVLDTEFAEKNGGIRSLGSAENTAKATGVQVDDQGNVFVLAKFDDEVTVVGMDKAGDLLADFGDNGMRVISGATDPGSLYFKDNRLIVSTKTGSSTDVMALLTPTGFESLPVAVATTVGSSSTGAFSAPSPFAGPVVTGVVEGGLSATVGGSVRVQGQNLADVTEAKIGGLDAEVLSVTNTSLELGIPEGLEVGVYSLVLTSAQGVVSIEDAIRIQTGPVSANRGDGQWTKAITNTDGSYDSVKMYAKDPIGVGKVQFMVNGQEIAWIRAEDESDPKLREASNGVNYLVRTVDLLPGKNALEIYIDGERVWRAAYTLR